MESRGIIKFYQNFVRSFFFHLRIYNVFFMGRLDWPASDVNADLYLEWDVDNSTKLWYNTLLCSETNETHVFIKLGRKSKRIREKLNHLFFETKFV